MHAILALAACHIHFLQPSASIISKSQLFHWQRTLSTFGKKLSQPIDRGQANAMLATATLVNGIAFAATESKDPESSWPWSNSSGNDLQWLKLQGGIVIVLESTQTLAEPTPFRGLFDEDDGVQELSNEDKDLLDAAPGTNSALVAQLAQLCEVTRTSSRANNPYFTPLSLLAPLLRDSATTSNVFEYLGFVGNVTKEFIALLQAKDHRALLLLCLWYATICRVQYWWTASRSNIECKAIMMYLDTYADHQIKELLPFAAQACEYTLGSRRPSGDTKRLEVSQLCQMM